MNASLLLIVLIGLGATLAKPTGRDTANTKNLFKDAAGKLLQMSDVMQRWGNDVLDAAYTGFDTKTMQDLRQKMTNDMATSNDDLEPYVFMMSTKKSSGISGNSADDIAEMTTAMLKDGVDEDVLSDDDRLALVAGDALSTDAMRLRLNVRIFERVMGKLGNTVEDLIDLLSDDNEDEEIFDEFLGFVGELGAESAALSIVFTAMEDSFKNGQNLIGSIAEETSEEADGEESATPRRQRRSPGGFNLGGGWSVGLGGASWSNRRGNVHVNVGPTFGSGGFGGQASLRIEF